jgi:hypothetical protein
MLLQYRDRTQVKKVALDIPADSVKIIVEHTEKPLLNVFVNTDRITIDTNEGRQLAAYDYDDLSAAADA